MKRVLAVLGAVAMVAAGFGVRGWLDDRDGGSSSGSGGSTTDRDEASTDGSAATLLCDDSLGTVCDTLAAEFDDLTVDVRDAGTVLDELTEQGFEAGDAGYDGWLAPNPLPEMLRDERDRAGLSPVLAESTATLARSPLVVAAWGERADALAPSCEDESITWRCIGDHAGEAWADVGGQPTWGDVEPGFASPQDDSLGILVAGQASTSFFGDAGFASNDFDTDGFRGWLRNLEDSVPRFPSTVGTPLVQMLTLGPSSYDFVGTTEAETAREVAGTRDEEAVVVLYPAPMATADVVLAPIDGAPGAERLTEILESSQAAAALNGAGWRVEGETPIDGVGDQDLPDDDGLPRAGVLLALRQL